MKKVVLAWLTLSVVVLASWLIGRAEVYVDAPVGGVVLCKQKCWHEATHALDDRMGWVSRSREFKGAVDGYIAERWAEARNGSYAELTENEKYIMNMPGVVSPEIDEDKRLWWHPNEGWGGYAELYAQIVQNCRGERSCVPNELRRFYDFEWLTRTHGRLTFDRYHFSYAY